MFEFFSSDRLNALSTRARDANLEFVSRVDTELATAVEELDALRGRSDALAGAGELHEIVTGMITRVQARIVNLNDERVALTTEHPEPLTHEQLVAVWPTLNNESRRTVLRQVIRHIDLAPGRGHPSERLNIALCSDE